MRVHLLKKKEREMGGQKGAGQRGIRAKEKRRTAVHAPKSPPKKKSLPLIAKKRGEQAMGVRFQGGGKRDGPIYRGAL